MLKYIPNLLTILRFILIPIILFFLFTGNYLIAFVVFTLSGLTDIADGCIARKYNLISTFGKLMDPLADKLTQISVLTALVFINVIPLWILLIVIIKECIMVAGASFLYGKDVVVYSRWYGKLATVIFYVAIVISLLTKQFNATGFWTDLDLIVYCIALIMTLISLILYVHDLYKNGVLNKNDLQKDVTDVSIKKNKNKENNK